MRPVTPRAILGSAAVALCLGLAFITLMQGFSASYPLRLVQGVALFGAGALVLGFPLVWLALRMADWRDPGSEHEFERIVQRSERLARDGLAVEPREDEFLELDPYRDEDFEELVREALDELPDLLQDALQRNVGVMISDAGRRHGAYGLYRGDGVARDNVPDQIFIFRDTLRRDFGHDADLLRDQVTITVRHELAHHVGFDEMGVRGLGL